jgi:hypothetical protein
MIRTRVLVMGAVGVMQCGWPAGMEKAARVQDRAVTADETGQACWVVSR